MTGAGRYPPRFVVREHYATSRFLLSRGIDPLTAMGASGIISAAPNDIGAWPSGKAPGFGPGIAGSNPAAPARGRERDYLRSP
jgi:hypothetical protein